MIAAEQCDDNNNQNGDGCTAACKTEPGFICQGNKPSVCRPTGPYCGDGQINTYSEKCDLGNKNGNGNSGCSSSCAPETGYECVDNVCSLLPVDSGLTLAAPVYVNFNNVFVALSTPKAYTFNNEAEMRSFMKYSFEDDSTIPTSAYCLQRVADLKTFECLLIYASGVPNKLFKARFYYNHDGDVGSKVVTVDPLSSTFSSRSLK